MTPTQKNIARQLKTVIYWTYIAERDAKAGDFAGAARALQNAADHMHQATIADLHRYYQTEQENEIMPGLSDALAWAKEQAKKELIEDGENNAL